MPKPDPMEFPPRETEKPNASTPPTPTPKPGMAVPKMPSAPASAALGKAGPKKGEKPDTVPTPPPVEVVAPIPAAPPPVADAPTPATPPPETPAEEKKRRAMPLVLLAPTDDPTLMKVVADETAGITDDDGVTKWMNDNNHEGEVYPVRFRRGTGKQAGTNGRMRRRRYKPPTEFIVE